MNEAEVAQQFASDVVANAGVIVTVILCIGFVMMITSITILSRAIGLLQQTQELHGSPVSLGKSNLKAANDSSHGYQPKIGILSKSSNNKPQRERIVKRNSSKRFSA